MAYAVRSTRVGSPGFLRELEQAVWSVVSQDLRQPVRSRRYPRTLTITRTAKTTTVTAKATIATP